MMKCFAIDQGIVFSTLVYQIQVLVQLNYFFQFSPCCLFDTECYLLFQISFALAHLFCSCLLS